MQGTTGSFEAFGRSVAILELKWVLVIYDRCRVVAFSQLPVKKQNAAIPMGLRIGKSLQSSTSQVKLMPKKEGTFDSYPMLSREKS